MGKTVSYLRFILRMAVYGFAVIGFVLTAGFFGVRMGWTNVEGNSDARSETYNALAVRLASIPVAKADKEPEPRSEEERLVQEQLCIVSAIGRRSPQNALSILNAYAGSDSVPLLANMVLAASIRLEGDAAFTQEKAACATIDSNGEELDPLVMSLQYKGKSGGNLFSWMDKEEWQTIEGAITKDKAAIDKAATLSGVSARMIVATCIVEQLRLYNTQRELYQKVFQPLTILSTANKMAWGVMAIKEDTAIQTESHLQDVASPYYLGKEQEGLLAFNSKDSSGERYKRLTDQHDHFYSYLYGGLYLAQVARQWERAGYSVAERPEIMATLYNIGFKHSVPKEKPEVGGSMIDIGGASYTFGSLAYEFYYSGRLADLFPYES